MEQWKEVVDYPTYEISDMGNVRRWDPKRRLKIRVSVAPAPFYIMFNVWENRINKKLYVHREMLKAFIPCSDPKLTHVCFKDGDITNLKLSNLYWSSQTKRMRRRHKEGGYPKGQDHYMAKLTDQDVIEMKAMWESEEYTQQFIADKFGIHPTTLNNILKGRYWTHLK